MNGVHGVTNDQRRKTMKYWNKGYKCQKKDIWWCTNWHRKKG